LDLFVMATSADAFGAYHHDSREGASAGCGAESEYMGGSLYFWEGRVFGSVVALQETPASTAAVHALGQAAASAAARASGAPSSPPALLRRLPRSGLAADRQLYFHGWEYLNTRYFIAEHNLLQLGDRTEGVLGQYPAAGSPDTPAVVLIVSYPSAVEARAAQVVFLKGYLPDADGAGLARTENARWAGVAVAGAHLMCVLDARSRPVARRLLSEALRPPLAPAIPPPGAASSPKRGPAATEQP